MDAQKDASENEKEEINEDSNTTLSFDNKSEPKYLDFILNFLFVLP